MKLKPTLGLLPFYLKLYDHTDPGRRVKFAPLLEAIKHAFRQGGVDVISGEIACVESEFRQAVAAFERADVDLLVSVHLAYSPSLESAGPLCDTSIPLLILDTTMDYDFGLAVDPARISFDHGIHGVQDLASVLRRHGRPYEIVVGHVEQSDVLDRAVEVARAAHAARRFRGSRVLRIGESFQGMGDFAVPAASLEETFGIVTEQALPADLAKYAETLEDKALQAERDGDHESFVVDAPDNVHLRSLRVGLALRALLAEGDFDAFSMNFLAFDTGNGPINTVPFLEASKGMGRGMGYAGEGDVLTACLVGALNAGFGRTTFTEIFCPDWKGGSLFMSHMGEINPKLADAKPRLVELDFPYTDAQSPAVLACALAPGRATLVNLAPGPHETFGLLVAGVDVLGDGSHPDMQNCIRGWIRPSSPLPEFLARYSQWGGTHHSALVYGEHADAIAVFGRLVGLDVHML